METFIQILILIGIAIILSLILAYPEMLLWNWLMPKIFGLPTITYWQMVGLDILIYILLPHKTSSSSE